MPNIIVGLVVDRVDFVDEGANSAAFIKMYKRREKDDMDLEEVLAKLKPEHAEVVKAEIAKQTANVDTLTVALNTANDTISTVNKELTAAKDTIVHVQDELKVAKAKQKCECAGEADGEGICKACGLKKEKSSASFDETEVMKGMPEQARELFIKMRDQKNAAEESLRKEKLEKQHSDAVAKASALKALPVDNAKLIEICKKGDQDVIDVLTTVSAAIDGVVLKEVGGTHSTGGTDAWSKIEAKAAEVAKRDNITKQKAVSVVIKECPELYKEYLNRG